MTQLLRTGLAIAIATTLQTASAQTYQPYNYYTFDNSNALADIMNNDALNVSFFQSPYSILSASASGAVGKSLSLNSASRQIVASNPLSLTDGFTIEFLFKPGSNINETVQLFGRRDGAIQIRFMYPTIRFITKIIPTGSTAAVSDLMEIDLDGIGRKSYGYYVDGNWHHLVFKYNAATGQKEVWVDGQSPASFKTVTAKGKFASNSSNINNNILDINTNTDYYKFNGALDEIAIYKYDLHPNMIYKHYTEFLQGNHYTWGFTSTAPPAAASVSGPIDISEYAPGHPNTNVDAVTQLKTFPVPRYKSGNTLFPNIPVFDPARVAGYMQPNYNYNSVLQKSKEVQRQLVTAFNYTLMVSSNTHDVGHFGDTTKFAGAWIKMANDNPSWKTSANSYWAQLNPNGIGYSSSDAYVNCKCLPNSSYLRNSSGQFLDRNGNVTSVRHISPAMPTDSLSLDGLTQRYYVDQLTKKMTRPLDLLFENGEEIVRWTQTGLQKDPSVVAAKNASGLSWDKYIGRNMKRLTAAYMDKIRSLPKLSNTWVEHYQLTALPGNWDWAESRTLNTQINGQYYSNGDLYLQYPKAWKTGLGMAKGWQDLVEQREVEISMGDKLFSPVVSAGWSLTEENIVRPAQYLGFLKAVALTGAENFHAGYFAITQPLQLPENYVWQFAMPSYAQALVSRFEDILRNGYVMEGDVPSHFADPNGTPGYQFAAGDIRKLVVVRKHNSQSKYVITGSIQSHSNMQGNVEAEGKATIKLDGQTLSFNVRRQGSTYIYDKSNASSPVFYQLDSWHESSHPYFWSKTFDIEAELYDNNPSGVSIKTQVPSGAAAGDFTDYTSFVTFSGTNTVEYDFTPRGNSTATHYLWVLARSADGSNTGFSASLDGGSSKTINCVSGQNWQWYRFDATTGQAIAFNNLSLNKHTLALTAINNKLQIDKITLTPNSGNYYSNGAGPCNGSVTPAAVITASGSTSFCQGGSVILTANTGTAYQWSTGSTSKSITVNTAGTYTVTVTTSGGSAVSAPVSVQVNPKPSANVTASGPLSFCTGGSVTLTAPSGSGNSYLWSPGGQTTQSVTVNSTGTYNVRVTNSFGCTAVSSNQQVTSSSSSGTSTVSASGPTTFCEGGSVNLTANQGTSYQWSNGATTRTINVSNAGNYSVTVTNGSCSSSPSSPVAIRVTPKADFTTSLSGPLSFCQGGSVTITVNSNNASAYVWYKDNKVISSVGNYSKSYKATTAGTYKVRVQRGGCGTFAPPFKVTTPCREGESLEVTEFDATVYPNPFENQTTIQVNSVREDEVSISIFDVEGRLVDVIAEKYQIPAGVSEFTYDANHLRKGVYFAVVNTLTESRKIKIASLK